MISLKGDPLSAFRNRFSLGRWSCVHAHRGAIISLWLVINMGPKAAGKMGSLQAKKRPKPTVYTTWTVLEQDVLSTLALPGLNVRRHLFRGHQSVG